MPWPWGFSSGNKFHFSTIQLRYQVWSFGFVRNLLNILVCLYCSIFPTLVLNPTQQYFLQWPQHLPLTLSLTQSANATVSCSRVFHRIGSGLVWSGWCTPTTGCGGGAPLFSRVSSSYDRLLYTPRHKQIWKKNESATYLVNNRMAQVLQNCAFQIKKIILIIPFELRTPVIQTTLPGIY